MALKIVTCIILAKESCYFNSHSVTSGIKYKLTQKHVHNNLTDIFLITEFRLSGIVSQTRLYLQVQLKFLKNV